MNLRSVLGLSQEDKTPRWAWGAAFALVALVALSSSAEGSPSAEDYGLSPECTHAIVANETLSDVASANATTWQAIHTGSPWIGNPHIVHPGDVVNVCVEPAPVRQLSAASSVSPRMVGACAGVDDEANRRALARALISKMPAQSGKSDVIRLVSVAGGESLFGCDIWNPADAGNGYIGSIGMLQTRTLGDGHRAAQPGRFDSFRQVDFLVDCPMSEVTSKPARCLGNLENQAEGTWAIYNTFGFIEASWGAVPLITASDRELATNSVEAVWSEFFAPAIKEGGDAR